MTPSHALSDITLQEYLLSEGIPGVSGIDTRALTRRLRVSGVMMGAVAVDVLPDEALAQLRRGPRYDDHGLCWTGVNERSLRLGGGRNGIQWSGAR